MADQPAGKHHDDRCHLSTLRIRMKKTILALIALVIGLLLAGWWHTIAVRQEWVKSQYVHTLNDKVRAVQLHLARLYQQPQAAVHPVKAELSQLRQALTQIVDHPVVWQTTGSSITFQQQSRALLHRLEKNQWVQSWQREFLLVERMRTLLQHVLQLTARMRAHSPPRDNPTLIEELDVQQWITQHLLVFLDLGTPIHDMPVKRRHLFETSLTALTRSEYRLQRIIVDSYDNQSLMYQLGQQRAALKLQLVQVQNNLLQHDQPKTDTTTVLSLENQLNTYRQFLARYNHHVSASGIEPDSGSLLLLLLLSSSVLGLAIALFIQNQSLKRIEYVIDAPQVQTLCQSLLSLSTQGSEDVHQLQAQIDRHQTQLQSAHKTMEHVIKNGQDVAESITLSNRVATQSVQLSANGVHAVQEIITSMDSLHTRINSTAQQLQKLGTSSSEIGEILQFIEEIAERTNVLAINAAIQSTIVGNSGDGFARVADEVQSLAERTSDATHSIKQRIDTIQDNTYQAISAMAHSTQDMVNSIELAHDAGVALEAIEFIAAQLAESIEGATSVSKAHYNHIDELAITTSQLKQHNEQQCAYLTVMATNMRALKQYVAQLVHVHIRLGTVPETVETE